MKQTSNADAGAADSRAVALLRSFADRGWHRGTLMLDVEDHLAIMSAISAAPTAEQAEGVRVARDAARYRLIRAGFGDFGPEVDLHNAFVDGGEKLDAALDKLLAAPAASTGDQ
jgi:hypothetical protein